MKKLLLWLLMVVLFVALILGGAVAAVYFTIGEEDLPDQTASFGGVTLENSGYQWDVPIFGGIFYKHYNQPANLSVQKLGDFGDSRPELVLPDWVTSAQFQLTNPDGSVACTGDASAYSNFTYSQNGTYTLELTLRQESTEKPAKPLGWYLYRATFTVNFQPEVQLSRTRVSQGEIVAVTVSGSFSSEQPTADTDLGNIWFRQTSDGWMGYIAVPYNCSGGEHTIHITCGQAQTDLVLSVGQTQYGNMVQTPSAPASEAVNEEYRNAIWPLYQSSEQGKLWSGAFQHPCDGSVIIPYGTVYLVNGARSGQSTCLTYAAAANSNVYSPQAGVVAYAGTLGLTGGTVVIDHGCGVKSYLFGLGQVTAQRGQTVAKGDVVGTFAADRYLEYEIRIGNKSADPAKAIAGQSGLQYREDL